MKNDSVKIKNFTPHEVVVLNDQYEVVARFPSEGVIRLSEERLKIGDANGIPIYKKSFGGSESLPPEEDGTVYIVSLPVAQAFPSRSDFIVPDQLVRDDQGRIIGCRAFARVL